MSSQRPPKEPIQASSIISKVLEDLDLGPAARGVRIQHLRVEALGPVWAAHAQPGDLQGVSLEGLVEASVWAQQLQMEVPAILQGLRNVLGEDSPSAIRFRILRARS